ncbi:hypothetical protein [Puia sp.]|uniref:hypothetical protein n=1 Tax=Puia sp. TaxID=2045100 RepID=UPI002F40AE96
MLQNRVNPFGNIIRTAARGHWLGNRGVIHNERQEVTRPFRLKAWIACLLSFKGRKRVVMSPGRWTELFFFDEATAFSAGHRPCFECRRADAVRFKRAWIAGNPEYGFHEKTPIGEIDKILHRERVAEDGSKVRFEAELGRLPDGSFIEWQGDAWLVWEGLVYRWAPEGYSAGVAGPGGRVRVLTPASVVKAFGAGYMPQVGLDTDADDGREAHAERETDDGRETHAERETDDGGETHAG